MTYDVVIVGAGPVGLFLATELALAKVSVLVVERAPDARSPLKEHPLGMRGLSVPTVEALDRRGMLARLLAGAPDGPRRHAGHFAGIPLDASKIDFARWTWRRPGPADTNQAATMAHIEAVLAERAAALGVEVRYGAELTALEATADQVRAHVGDDAVEARWLVGCDGGRSRVRKLAGFDFVGTEPQLTGYTALVDIAEPNPLLAGRNLTPKGLYFQTQPGHIAVAELDGGAFDRAEGVSREHLEGVLRRVSGTDVTIAKVHLASSWTDRCMQAATYRKGRVLLAGDAAHIHSPLGGQGLNLGLGDAMNLGWKLAATIHGTAPDGLLDTYTSERHPVGAQVLDWSRAQIAMMRGDAHARALEAILRDLIATRDGTTYFAERIWGVGLRYDLGDAHPLVGRSAPDLELDDGTRLGERMRSGKGLLVDIDGTLGPFAQVDHVRAKDALGLTAFLVRPDGFVAWATNDAARPADAERAVRRWFRS